MKIHYSQLREDLGQFETAECDSYKFEVHPVTGKVTLHLHETIGTAQHVKMVVSGVIQFRVERLR